MREVSILIHAFKQVLSRLLADIDTRRALFPLLLLTFLSSNVHALSCAQPKLDEATIKNSVAVFEGVAGNKHSLTWQQKASVKMDRLTGRFAGVENLSVYDFRVTKNWEGVTAGQTVTILFNTTWGDNYVPGSYFLIVSPQQIGGMYWTPLCGNSIDLEWARKNGDIELLEEVIGIGQQIKIVAKDRVCESSKDCTAVSTHCGGCDCGTPVSAAVAGKYKEQLQTFCAITRLMEHCEIVCESFVPACEEGLCR
jgi:hypothetical protein